MLAKRMLGIVLTLMLLVPLAGFALAQADNGSSQQREKAQLEQMVARYKQRRMQTIKQSLGCTDDEFKILEPKVERILLIQLDQLAGSGQLNRRGGRGPASGGSLNSLLPPSDLMKAHNALQEAVNDKALPPGVIVQRLKDWRAARDASHEELLRAQGDLRDFLTVRQEAVAVTIGLLD